jgi:hypothetical protein
VSRNVLWGTLVAIAVLTAGCGSDSRPQSYLEAMPEGELVYPGATLTGSFSQPERGNIEGPDAARVGHRFTVAATQPEIVDWYATQLADMGWRRVAGDGDPSWERTFTTFALRHLRAPEDQPGSTTFSAELSARRGYSDSAPLDALAEALEKMDGIQYPADDSLRPLRTPRFVYEDAVAPARIERTSYVAATEDEVQRHYDHVMSESGWTQITSVPPFTFGHLAPDRMWTRGDLYAALTTYPRRGSASSQPQVGFDFELAEVLGPEVSPGAPWTE